MRDGDGLPTLDTGEPVLARWFVILLLVLVPVGIGLIVWALTSIDSQPLPVAERRPPGTARVTHDRGDAVLNEDRTTQPGPGCGERITLIGDPGARAAAERALSAACQLLDRPGLEVAARGLERWADRDGVLRFAVFRRSGVDASSRVDDGRAVIELNAKFQFRDATEAAPMVVHELAHLGQGWPGEPVGAAGELEAMRAQAVVCDLLTFRRQEPRGCRDADQLLDDPDPLGALVDAGYRRR